MFQSLTRRRRAAPRLSTQPPTRPPQPSADDQPILGCGWFDSSHDLRQGLLANELPPDQPLPAALALEMCLAA